jgi:hypothetical protein
MAKIAREVVDWERQGKIGGGEQVFARLKCGHREPVKMHPEDEDPPMPLAGRVMDCTTCEETTTRRTRAEGEKQG